jgi:glycosyltransferase involved in cell wall biosynthesis
LEVKRILPDSKIVVIVPDLPLNMDMSSLVQRILKKIDWRIIKRLMCSVDKYILYTRHMADYLNLRPEQWIVVEGLIDESKVQDYPVPSKYEKKVCLYMGTLKKEYKIDKFVEAFIIANIPNTELHIYGNGDLKNELIRISQKYHTIKYCGYVSSDEAFNIMKKATLLVNPRPTNDDYTRYSCPSKTFEYMASGTPLLTTKLLGIPDEYFEYVYSFEDESIEGMASTLKRILIKDDLELNKQGLRAREFIKKYKSNYKQCEKVVKFLSEN